MPRISRREMLRSGAMASVFAASGGPLLARGQRGGRLRAGLSGATKHDSWDMRGPAGLFMHAAGQGAVFECLTEVAADGALKGELAERWTSFEGARVWEFALRRDVHFHNGQLFTADDVIATLESHGALPEVLAQIEQVSALGKHGLRITLARPNPNFPYELSHPQFVIQPRGGYAGGIGTGLYSVAHFAAGQRFLGRRVGDHWKGQSAGFADEVEFIALNTPAEQRAALRAGVVDVVSDLGAHGINGLRGVRLEQGIAMTRQIQMPKVTGTTLHMDNARFAERWWMS